MGEEEEAVGAASLTHRATGRCCLCGNDSSRESSLCMSAFLSLSPRAERREGKELVAGREKRSLWERKAL